MAVVSRTERVIRPTVVRCVPVTGAAGQRAASDCLIATSPVIVRVWPALVTVPVRCADWASVWARFETDEAGLG